MTGHYRLIPGRGVAASAIVDRMRNLMVPPAVAGLTLAATLVFSAEAVVPSKDGVAIHYESRGEGDPAVVLVHCWSCDRHLWDAVVPRIARDHRVVTLDLAGHGASGRGRRDWTIQAFGEDVRAVVEALHLKKVVLVGHSMGGPVILEAARLLPGRVVGLVPVDTGLNVEQTSTPEEVAGFIAPFEKDYRATADAFTRKYMFTPKSDPAVVDRVAARNAAAPPEIAIPCLRAALGYDARPTLEKVRVPAHAVNADLYPTDVEANRRHFASYDVTIMKGVGHYVMLEDPARFSDLLADAIAQLLAKPPGR
jgi:pimeloyl-ACP methyl ester carboxylesterase